jgi:hypothetical protein
MLRAFDPATRLWSIWWLDGRSPARLDVPMRGRFTQGLGEFYADDTFDGKAIKVRFFCGRRATPIRPCGLKRFLRTRVRAGKPTGSCVLAVLSRCRLRIHESIRQIAGVFTE